MTPTTDAPSPCPPSAPSVEACGCGCCGAPQGRACYYPELGESAATVDNPKPGNCATAGCSAGVRYQCCGGPGAPAATGATYCRWIDRSQDGGYHVVKAEGGTCTTLDLTARKGLGFPVSMPPDLHASAGSRGPCDGSSPAEPAIGALGRVEVGGASLGSPLDVHVVLFFDGGATQTSRLDVNADDFAASCP